MSILDPHGAVCVLLLCGVLWFDLQVRCRHGPYGQVPTRPFEDPIAAEVSRPSGAGEVAPEELERVEAGPYGFIGGGRWWSATAS